LGCFWGFEVLKGKNRANFVPETQSFCIRSGHNFSFWSLSTPEDSPNHPKFLVTIAPKTTGSNGTNTKSFMFSKNFNLTNFGEQILV